MVHIFATAQIGQNSAFSVQKRASAWREKKHRWWWRWWKISAMILYSQHYYHMHYPWQCLVLPAQSRRSFPAPALLSSLGCHQRDLRGKLSRCNILLFVSIIFVFYDHFLGDIKTSIPAPQKLFWYALRISLSVLIRDLLNYSCGSLPFRVL